MFVATKNGNVSVDIELLFPWVSYAYLKMKESLQLLSKVSHDR